MTREEKRVWETIKNLKETLKNLKETLRQDIKKLPDEQVNLYNDNLFEKEMTNLLFVSVYKENFKDLEEGEIEKIVQKLMREEYKKRKERKIR